ncbi:MAG: type II secretion system protein GspE [Desulfuromonas sp.]|nr:MAG: type II secretion system protein GspE [Desulfuromonas sp.]
MRSSWKPLGALLVEAGAISEQQRDEALAAQGGGPRRIGEILLAAKVLDAVQLGTALAAQLEVPFLAELPLEAYSLELLEKLPLSYCREHRLYPLALEDECVRVAVADPFDLRAQNDLVALTGRPLELVVATSDEILRALNRAYEQHAGEAQEFVEEIGGGEAALGSGFEPADLLDTSDEAPIIRFVNSLITQGYKERASDIHIEPYETELIVRYRIDGILYEVLRPPHKAQASILSRLKIMANLNIAEKRLPQDGRFRVRIAGKDIDVRVSTLPTTFGERIVLRLLDKATSVLSLEDIGMGSTLLSSIDTMIRKSHGIFLVTGPTGSGKTTTLYAALSRLNNREKNIITIEDPVEYQLAGVGQIQVNSKINLTFASGLRSILRQDPDIIMVGEIRDGETAEIAVQSALTGHMVFSTLHTNDAAGALTRLVEMGVEPFLAASSIVGILAQRLVRRICPHCREGYAATPELLQELGVNRPELRSATFYRGRGCDKCLQIGYMGRTGIYELLSMSESVRSLLLQNRDAASIKQAAQKEGMASLRDAGLALALKGETTLEEVMRVTQEEQ